MTEAAPSTQPHLYLVDGSSYIFRAYHRLPPLTNRHGQPAGAVYGYTAMLWKLADGLNKADGPTHMAVILDASEQTFRNIMYDGYKAHRPPPPEDLIPQFPLIRTATKAFSIPCIETAGLEADDIIACYVTAAKQAGWMVTIVSSDKDLMQLVEDGSVDMLDTMNDRRITEETVVEKFGVGPEKVGDVLALMGDSVDNVPGVPGVGPKTASQLIQQRSLTQSLDGHIARDNELTVDYGLQRSGAALAGLLVKAMKLDPCQVFVVAQELQRLNAPLEAHAVRLGQLVLVGKSRHFLFSPPVSDQNTLGPQTHGLSSHVDGRVSRPNHHDITSHWAVGQRTRLCWEDEVQSLPHARGALARDSKPASGAQADTQKNGVIAGMELRQLRGIHRRVESDFDTHLFDRLHLAKRKLGGDLVGGNAQRVEPARDIASLENRYCMPLFAEFVCAGKAGGPRPNNGNLPTTR